MLPLDLELIDENYLNTLIENEISENRHLEYKRTIPGPDWSNSRFLEEVASFANDGPGDLLLGVDAPDGIPTEIVGCESNNTDQETLRLGQIIENGLDPSYRQFRCHPITLQNGRVVFVLRISLSFARPHRVGAKGALMGRGPAGKTPMDMSQVRNMILQADRFQVRVRGFRQDRLAELGGGTSPVPINDGPAFVAHLVPLQAVVGPSSHIAPDMQQGAEYFRPLLGGADMSHRYNLEGTVFHVVQRRLQTPAYTHVYRTGIIESVLAHTWAPTREDLDDGVLAHAIVPIFGICVRLHAVLPGWIAGLQRMNIGPPYYLLLSMFHLGNAATPRYNNVGEYEMRYSDRDIMVVPDIELPWPTDELALALRPVFDMFAQAWGYDGSLLYDDDNWRPERCN